MGGRHKLENNVPLLRLLFLTLSVLEVRLVLVVPEELRHFDSVFVLFEFGEVVKRFGVELIFNSDPGLGAHSVSCFF